MQAWTYRRPRRPWPLLRLVLVFAFQGKCLSQNENGLALSMMKFQAWELVLTLYTTSFFFTTPLQKIKG